MHFNKKLDITNALLRISDSLAYGATARHVYGVINDTENKRKLVVRAKNNLAANTAEQTTLAFRLRRARSRYRSKQRQNDRGTVCDLGAAIRRRDRHRGDAGGEREPKRRQRATTPSNLCSTSSPAGRSTRPRSKRPRRPIASRWRSLKRAKRELKNVVARAVKDEKGAVDHWVWELAAEEDGI